MPNPILLYDGVCGLCNRFVQFVLQNDRNHVFHFAPLQSAFSRQILTRHGVDPTELDTVYVLTGPDPASRGSDPALETLLSRSDAIIFVLKELGGLWRPYAFLLQLLPKFLRDSYYKIIARHRYRIFGRSDTCPLPSERHRDRFLDF